MSTTKNYKIIVVYDQDIIRSGLKLFLENKLGHSIIAEANNGEKFLELTNIHNSAIIHIDIQTPVLYGLEASKQILLQYNNLKIIAITMYHAKAYMKNLVERGIKDFVHKSSTFSEFNNILNMVYNKDFCFPDDMKIEME